MATASRLPAYPMAESASAIPRTPPAQCSGSLRTNGMHFSAAHARESLTGSADSMLTGQGTMTPCSHWHLIRRLREQPLALTEGRLAYVSHFTSIWLAG